MIYIDSNFCCHTTNPEGTFREVILSKNAMAFFANKCTAFIEGFRLVPTGESWTRSDGEVFHGEMISAWKPYSELAAAQAQYKLDMAEATAAYQEGVNSAYDQ